MNPDGRKSFEIRADDRPTEPDVAILHEANGVVAVFKPAGLATQAPPGVDSVEVRVRRWIRRSGAGGYLGVPHRLDRPVSGVMLFAMTPRAARQVSRQFERRQIVKRYDALLECPSREQLPPGEGWAEWRDLIAKVPDEPRAKIVPSLEACKEAREAITRARLIESPAGDVLRGGGVIRVAFEPMTGRMHQLRLQAASRGMPVLGDAIYGSTRPFAEAAGPGVPPIALHAFRIEYIDPETRSTVVVESPPPWCPPVFQGGIQPADSIQT